MTFLTKSLLLFVFILFASGCNHCENQDESASKKPNESSTTVSTVANEVSSLSNDEVDDFKSKLIRHVGRKPENASQTTKFHSYFDEHYNIQFKEHELEYYAKDESGKIFFLFTRIAPSAVLKKVGIGGYVKFAEDGSIIELEEVFRTWKQVPDSLKMVTDVLFAKMVRAEDLSPYYTANCMCTNNIEFPDEFVFYNKETKTWESTQPDPLREFYVDKELIMEKELRKFDSIQNIKK